MNIRTFILLLLLAFTFLGCKSDFYPYLDTSLSFEKRAKDLLGRLTLEEKVSLMTNKSAAVERFGIPPYDCWNEALHGVAHSGKATVFPQSIGLAATFDDNAVYEMFDIVSEEARAKRFKGGDRTNIDLPQMQVNMLKTLAKFGKPLVFVICTGSTFVLFGDYNPAGCLPLTFYASSDQLPDLEDYNIATGRTYRYFKDEPLYPFGYGLSYTNSVGAERVRIFRSANKQYDSETRSIRNFVWRLFI